MKFRLMRLFYNSILAVVILPIGFAAVAEEDYELWQNSTDASMIKRTKCNEGPPFGYRVKIKACGGSETEVPKERIRPGAPRPQGIKMYWTLKKHIGEGRYKVLAVTREVMDIEGGRSWCQSEKEKFIEKNILLQDQGTSCEQYQKTGSYEEKKSVSATGVG